jgi:hypothetical protein
MAERSESLRHDHVKFSWELFVGSPVRNGLRLAVKSLGNGKCAAENADNLVYCFKPPCNHGADWYYIENVQSNEYTEREWLKRRNLGKLPPWLWI